MRTPTFVPRNFAINQLWTTTLWGDDTPLMKNSLPGFEKAYAIEDVEDYAMLIDKKRRAKSIPDHRPAVAPKEVWEGWDKWCENNGGFKNAWHHHFPLKWYRHVMGGIFKCTRLGSSNGPR